MRRPPQRPETYGSVLKEVGGKFKKLVESEVNLIQEEIKDTSSSIARHSAQAALFGALLGISIFPFLAFCVIGLGTLLNGRYWLSSLIVAAACAGIGGALAWRALRQMLDQDMTLPRARRTLAREGEIVSDTIEDIGDTVKGETANPKKGRAA